MGPPDVVYQHHPSTLRMNILPTVNDPSVPKRMLTCILSTLKANGEYYFDDFCKQIVYVKRFYVHQICFKIKFG